MRSVYLNIFDEINDILTYYAQTKRLFSFLIVLMLYLSCSLYLCTENYMTKAATLSPICLYQFFWHRLRCVQLNICSQTFRAAF